MKELNEKVTYRGNEYSLVFNFNVMEEIQNEYGTIDHWAELTEGGKGRKKNEPDAKAVIFGFTSMLNEGIEIDNEENGTDIKPLTHKQVGRMLTEIGLGELSEKMQKTVIKSTKSNEKNA